MSKQRGKEFSLEEALQQNTVRALFALLGGAFRCTRMLGKSPWELPLAEGKLRQVGVKEEHLQGLVEAKLIERRSEVLAAVPEGPVHLTKKTGESEAASWYVLTVKGMRLLDALGD